MTSRAACEDSSGGVGCSLKFQITSVKMIFNSSEASLRPGDKLARRGKKRLNSTSSTHQSILLDRRQMRETARLEN